MSVRPGLDRPLPGWRNRKRLARLAHRLHAVRKTPDSVVDLRRREGAERQAKEALAAAGWKKRLAVGEVETVLRRLGLDGARQHAFRERERDEEAAVGARSDRVRHVFVQTGETRVETRRVQRFQPFDLRRQESPAAPFV